MFPYKIDIAGKRKDVESIYCIGRNYVDHIEELKNEKPDKPLVFVKPKGAILLGSELTIPTTTKALHHECEILLSVGKSGENISIDQALSHIDGISIGLDFTARDLQDVEKQKGHPWTLSKCQKGFAVIGTWQSFVSRSYKFHLDVNGVAKQKGDTENMIYSFAAIVSYLSSIVPLYDGDIIYTGTPAGVSSVKKGDLLSGYLEDKKLFEILIG
jgi:acylpyruvate hydrolase